MDDEIAIDAHQRGNHHEEEQSHPLGDLACAPGNDELGTNNGVHRAPADAGQCVKQRWKFRPLEAKGKARKWHLGQASFGPQGA